MINKRYILTLFCVICCCFLQAQEDNNSQEADTTKTAKNQLPEGLKEKDNVVLTDSSKIKKVKLPREYDPLAPSRAAFYSAILPGLGQAYNGKYWKVPIVVGAITTGILFYDHNNKQYNRVRDAYKRRLAGFTDDEFYSRLTDDGLREAQKTFRRNKELSLLITFGLYALNIVDANIDAHLLQYNINEDLSLKPHYKLNEIDNQGDVGLTLNFKF